MSAAIGKTGVRAVFFDRDDTLNWRATPGKYVPATKGCDFYAVFFDRDGTLNCPAPPGRYIRQPNELRLLPGAAAAVRRINAAGLPAILATNQRWLSEPSANLGAYTRIETKLTRLLASEGAWLDSAYTCPHALGSCRCRKPLPGLLLRAAEDFTLSLRNSFFIGDSISDVQAGLAVGATAVLISSDVESDRGRLAHFVVGSVGEAVDRVLELHSSRAVGEQRGRPL
jgi:D-glycero-D-manno-heptose 1,7-bisphosphate phosphatase